MNKNLMQLFRKRKKESKKPKQIFTDTLKEKDYKLALELYDIFFTAIADFETSPALEEFVLQVEEIEKVESYFPKDKSINHFKRKIRKDYKRQIRLVL